jgi:hypothetical protein
MKPTARPYQSIAILGLRIIGPSQNRRHPTATVGRGQWLTRESAPKGMDF